MSENGSGFRMVKDKIRSRKLNPRVDLTAMVSVSFLLIVFFMVNAELSKPQVMNLGLPESCDDCCSNRGCIDYRRVVTLLLNENDKIISYRGLLNYPEENPKTIGYGKMGIRNYLSTMDKQIKVISGDIKKGTIVIIKPSKKSTYGNLVDILDEVAISNIENFAVVNDFTPKEYKLLASR